MKGQRVKEECEFTDRKMVFVNSSENVIHGDCEMTFQIKIALVSYVTKIVQSPRAPFVPLCTSAMSLEGKTIFISDQLCQKNNIF